MRRRGCLISFGALAGLTLVCCLLLWFVGLPRLQDSIADGIQEGLATEVAQQLGASGARLEPGTHTLSVADLERELQTSSGTDNVDNITFTAENGQLRLELDSQGQGFGYTAVPVAQDGRFELSEVDSTGDTFLDRIFPPDKLAGAVEGGVNSYFESQGLAITSVTAENGELVFETTNAGR